MAAILSARALCKHCPTVWAVAGSGGPQAIFDVGVLGDLPLIPATNSYFATEATRFHREADRDAAIAKVQHQRIDPLLDPSSQQQRVIEFVGALLIVCLFVVVSVAALVYVICDLVLHVRMQGSSSDLLVAALPGSMLMIAMSLLVAVRFPSAELSSGLLNLLPWPLLLLWGVFFSLCGAPALLQGAAGFLPLTQMLEAVRAVMRDGAPVAGIAGSLLTMAATTGLFLAIGGFFRRDTRLRRSNVVERAGTLRRRERGMVR